MTGPFHVVAHLVEDRHVTYAIYCNNIKYLVPPKSMPLKRRQAYRLCGYLNHVPWFWPEPPMTKRELEAAGR